MKPSHEAAEAIALDAFTFIASDEQLFYRIVVGTGIDPTALRAEPRNAHILELVMKHLAKEDNLVMAFASASGLKSEQIAAAADALSVAKATPQDHPGHAGRQSSQNVMSDLATGFWLNFP